MKVFRWGSLAKGHPARLCLGLVVSAAVALAGGPCSSINPKVSIEVHSDAGNKILSDGRSVDYTNGVSGVGAVINLCSGSGDITMTTGKTRKLKIDLTDYLISNPAPAWWADGTKVVEVQAFLNIRSVQGAFDTAHHDTPGAAAEHTFTTTMMVSFSVSGSSYNLDFANPSEDTETVGVGQWANYPQNTSLVEVHHIPASANTPETWEVRPLPDEGSPPAMRAGLVKTPTGKGKYTSVGQFNVPFRFTITKL